HLYVDIYTPSGMMETSNFLLYGPDKPDLWKAYQFCAERQLVFHLSRTDKDDGLESSYASVYIVFAQTFVFHGDEFIP
ncbi:hypothetical protein, partial [Salmonella sp. s54412]|uniref:hypothetical protein n=1 Tax=Salmonella sp. s54412 TaxID=3160128 RepID=UPI0037550C3A